MFMKHKAWQVPGSGIHVHQAPADRAGKAALQAPGLALPGRCEW